MAGGPVRVPLRAAAAAAPAAGAGEEGAGAVRQPPGKEAGPGEPGTWKPGSRILCRVKQDDVVQVKTCRLFDLQICCRTVMRYLTGFERVFRPKQTP